MATHSSILAWRISWTEKPGRLHPRGLQKVRHDQSDLHARMRVRAHTHTHTCVCTEASRESSTSQREQGVTWVTGKWRFRAGTQLSDLPACSLLLHLWPLFQHGPSAVNNHSPLPSPLTKLVAALWAQFVSSVLTQHLGTEILQAPQIHQATRRTSSPQREGGPVGQIITFFF